MEAEANDIDNVAESRILVTLQLYREARHFFEEDWGLLLLICSTCPACP